MRLKAERASAQVIARSTWPAHNTVSDHAGGAAAGRLRLPLPEGLTWDTAEATEKICRPPMGSPEPSGLLMFLPLQGHLGRSVEIPRALPLPNVSECVKKITSNFQFFSASRSSAASLYLQFLRGCLRPIYREPCSAGILSTFSLISVHQH